MPLGMAPLPFDTVTLKTDPAGYCVAPSGPKVALGADRVSNMKLTWKVLRYPALHVQLSITMLPVFVVLLSAGQPVHTATDVMPLPD